MEKKLRWPVAAMIVFCGMMCCNDNGAGPTEQPDYCYKNVDVVTSASTALKVDSINVYDTCAVVFWWERYDNYQVVAYRVEWGTDSTAFTDTIPFTTSTKRTNWSLIMQPLVANTTYYAQFYRDWHGTIVKTPFHFTTCSSESMP